MLSETATKLPGETRLSVEKEKRERDRERKISFDNFLENLKSFTKI